MKKYFLVIIAVVLISSSPLWAGRKDQKAEVNPQALPKKPLMWLHKYKLGDPIEKLRERYKLHLQDLGDVWFADVKEERLFFGYYEQNFYVVDCEGSEGPLIYKIDVTYDPKVMHFRNLDDYYIAEYKNQGEIIKSTIFDYGEIKRWIIEGTAENGKMVIIMRDDVKKLSRLILKDTGLLKKCGGTEPPLETTIYTDYEGEDGD